MIFVSYHGGAHGSYLEFVCNYVLANVQVRSNRPFDTDGTAHAKQYISKPIFETRHYSNDSKSPHLLKNSKIIHIEVTHDDLLPITGISFLRANGIKIDLDTLEKDTFNKLNKPIIRADVLDVLLEKYFSNHVLIEGYNTVKAEDWPDITNFNDFQNLPDWIKNECIDIHKFTYQELNETTPDCPRYILREFFKIGFKYPEQHGWMKYQNLVKHDPSNDIFSFPFGAFYDTEKFVQQIDAIGKWSGFSINNYSNLLELHEDFLKLQPYKNSKLYCDNIINRIRNREEFELGNLHLLYESYISAKLELIFDITLPFEMPAWFKHSKEIMKYI